jgi:hypothetical protein
MPQFQKQILKPLSPRHLAAAVRRARELCDTIERYSSATETREKQQLTRAIHGLAMHSRMLSARHRQATESVIEPKKHPIQPLVKDGEGVIRFKENAIVRFMANQVGLNNLATMNFCAEDWEQFAQLIGYSHSGAPSYVSDETLEAAMRIHEEEEQT